MIDLAFSACWRRAWLVAVLVPAAPAQEWQARRIAPQWFSVQAGAGGGPVNASGRVLYEFDGAAWRQAATVPTATQLGVLPFGFDPARGQQVLIEQPGRPGGGITHTNDGSGWIARGTAPPLQQTAPMVFHPGLQALMVFGDGFDHRWDGAAWQPMPAPVARQVNQARAASDPGRGVVVLSTETFSGAEQWEFDGVQWARLAPVGPVPPRRAFPLLGWDPRTGETMLFGGIDPGVATLTDTWLWNGTRWRQVQTPTVPQGFGAVELALDPVHRVLRLFGDAGSDWVFDGSDWNAVQTFGSRDSAQQGVDPILGHLIRFDGDGEAEWDGVGWQRRRVPVPGGRASMALDIGSVAMMALAAPPSAPGTLQTWLRQPSGWQPSPAATPPVRGGFALLCAPLSGGVVLFGGVDGGVDLDDTWLWSAGQWRDLTSTLGTSRPPAGLCVAANPASLVHDPHVVTPSQLWRWNGGWSQRSTVPPPFVARCAAVRGDGAVVVGGFDFSVPVARVAEFRGGQWSPLPQPREFQADALFEDPRRGALVAFYLGQEYVLTDTPADDPEVGLACGSPAPRLVGVGHPTTGNADYRAAVRTDAAAPVLLAFSDRAGTAPLGAGCTQWIGPPLAVRFALADATGLATFGLAIPAPPSLRGQQVFAQAAALQAGAPLGGVAVTAALRITVGD
ncbi:MAG: hypothetical protein AB7O97_20465 [Planctomycetota bacterium]